MAIHFTLTSQRISRSGSFLDPSADWTKCWWSQVSFFDFIGVNLRALAPAFMDFSGDWLFTGSKSESTVSPPFSPTVFTQITNGSVFDETSPHPYVYSVWQHIALRYDSGSTTLDIVVNGVSVASVVKDLTGLPVNAEFMGPNTDSEAFSVAYARDWQAKLTLAELLVEAAATTAQRTTDLLADTPLPSPSNLLDTSGNGRGWVQVSAAPVAVDGPFDGPNTACTTTDTDIICSGSGTPETNPMRRYRRFALPFDRDLNVFIARIELLIQSGMSPNTDWYVHFSRDGGETFGDFIPMASGSLGDFTKRLYLNRVGLGRNWVAGIMYQAAYPAFVIDFFVDVEIGTS